MISIGWFYLITDYFIYFHCWCHANMHPIYVIKTFHSWPEIQIKTLKINKISLVWKLNCGVFLKNISRCYFTFIKLNHYNKYKRYKSMDTRFILSEICFSCQMKFEIESDTQFFAVQTTKKCERLLTTKVGTYHISLHFFLCLRDISTKLSHTIHSLVFSWDEPV